MLNADQQLFAPLARAVKTAAFRYEKSYKINFLN